MMEDLHLTDSKHHLGKPEDDRLSPTDVLKMKKNWSVGRVHPEDVDEHDFYFHKTRSEIQTLRRKRIQEACKKENLRKQNPKIQKNKVDVTSIFNPASIIKLITTKVKELYGTIEKLGFFSIAASLFFFRNSLILLSITCFLSFMESHEDTKLNTRVFGEGLMMLSPRLNVFQMALSILAMIFGFLILYKEKSCLIYIYSTILAANIAVVIGNIVIIECLAKKDVVRSYLNSQVLEYKNHKPYKLGLVMLSVHTEFKCCGSNGVDDFMLNTLVSSENNDTGGRIDLPLSCCSFEFSSIPVEYKSECYYKESSNDKKTEDLIMMKVLNTRGCSKEVTRFLNNRKKFEILYSSFVLSVLIPIFLFSFWFFKKLKIKELECYLRNLLREHKSARQHWKHLRLRFFHNHNTDDPEGSDSRIVEILKEGVRKCSNADEISDFIMGCKEAADLIQEKLPMDLAEDIVSDASIYALRGSRPNFMVTSSEEIQEKMTKCTSLTELHVNEKREKVAEETKAHITQLHGEHCSAKGKIKKMKSAITIRPSAISNIAPERLHNRKSLIQGQLKMHELKYQKLRLAKIIAACKRRAIAIENRKIKYAMTHREIPPKVIFDENWEFPKDFESKPPSATALYLNKKITHTVFNKSGNTNIPVIDLVDKSTATNHQKPKIYKQIGESCSTYKLQEIVPHKIKTSILSVTILKIETKASKLNKSAVPQVQAETDDIGIQVHTTDLSPNPPTITTATQTDKQT